MISVSDFAPVFKLIQDTEANIKRIELANKRFVPYTLNEWRYATRHLVEAVAFGKCEDIQKAENHFKRAFYDSCEILADCLMARFAEFHGQFRGYSSIVSSVVTDFAQKCRLAIELQECRRNTVSSEKSRAGAYEKMREISQKLDDFLAELESSRPMWLEDIRKQKLRDRLPVIVSVAGIIVAIILAIAFR